MPTVGDPHVTSVKGEKFVLWKTDWSRPCSILRICSPCRCHNHLSRVTSFPVAATSVCSSLGPWSLP